MINKITETLKGISQRASDGELRGDANFTKACMEALTSLAYDKNYHVYGHANAIDPTMNEWLYDMVWYTPESSSIFHIKEIHLVVESEWKMGPDEIEYDFYKLIQARANFRLFIFQATDVQAKTDYLKKIIENSSIAVSGDEYLFAGWNEKAGEFMFNSFNKN